MKAETALSLLAPKAGRVAERVDGGIQHIRWEEVSGALAAVEDNLARLILRVKWGGQECWMPRLMLYTHNRAHSLFKQRGWRFEKARTLTAFVNLALAELLEPPVCRRCNGSGVVELKKEEQVVCEICGGFGRRPGSNRARARAVGLSEVQWRRLWGERYEQFFASIQELESDALKTVTRNMKDHAAA